jgi:hypothetical protein
VHTKIYLLLLFVLTVLSASAQKNLVVYHITGDVNIVTGNKSSLAKRGDVLVKNNSMQMGNGADCMLIEQNGKSLQVNTAGTYSYEVLQKMMSSTSKEGVTQKFFSYVYENLFTNKKEDKLSVTPVVFRNNELMKTPSDNTIIISDAFTVGWKNPSGKMWAHLIIKDSSDKIVIDTVIKHASSLQINIAENDLQSGHIYKWKVEESGTRQHTVNYFHFLIAEKNDRKQILKDLKLLQDKNMSNNLKVEMQQDIFLKWKQYYLQKT